MDTKQGKVNVRREKFAPPGDKGELFTTDFSICGAQRQLHLGGVRLSAGAWEK